MPLTPEPPYTHGTIAKTGIVLVNLGTPDEPTPAAVRRYLREFLSDPRVVEIPKPVWWLILNVIILNVRPKKSAEKYATIWTPDGSPLRLYTDRQAKLLKGLLGARVKAPFAVEHAMRYGTPSIADTLARLKADGCDRILVLPLYPQYAASTTASVFDKVFEFFGMTRNPPELRLVKHFHDHPAYIRALGDSVREFWLARGRPDFVLMSFHGVPRFTLDKGDPYHCECHKTGRLLAADLELQPDRFQVSFQSRFGEAEWLKPYTAELLAELPRRGVKRLDVMCPGFVSDCLETLEEIAMEGRDTFLEAGGKEFNLIPCLNDRPGWIAALAAIVGDHVGGWLSTTWDAASAQRDARASAERARAMGAAR